MPTNQQGAACRPTIVEAIELMGSGRLTSAELTENCLTRIRDLDRSIRAWVKVDENGAGPRRRIAIAKHGLVKSSARCTVFRSASKILSMSREWLPSLAPWRAGHVAERDAPVVARLREAGAVILGKTHTTQFAFINSAGTHNPWNLNHSPGGSSSGSAAAVAAEMCSGARSASQTGGSTIRPAAFCGDVGVKPTYGSIDTAGVVPLSRPLDTIGLMTSCVDDARVMLGVMQGRAIAGLSAGSKPPSLGFVEEFFMAWAGEAVQMAVEERSRHFARPARRFIPCRCRPASQVQAIQTSVMSHGAAETHREEFSRREAEYGKSIAELIREGLALRRRFRQSTRIKTIHRRYAVAFRTSEASGQILIMPATLEPARKDCTRWATRDSIPPGPTAARRW